MNIPSNIKAIPVAVMLAMSPMTTTNASEIMNSAQVEQVVLFDDLVKDAFYLSKEPDNKNLPEKYKKSFNNYYDERLYYSEIHNDKNTEYKYKDIAAYITASKDNNVFITFNTKECGSDETNYDSKFVAHTMIPNKLKVLMEFIDDKNGELVDAKTHYIIVGDGWENNIACLNSKSEELPVNTAFKEKADIEIEVNKEFFNKIKEMGIVPLEKSTVRIRSNR